MSTIVSKNTASEKTTIHSISGFLDCVDVTIRDAVYYEYARTDDDYSNDGSQY